MSPRWENAPAQQYNALVPRLAARERRERKRALSVDRPPVDAARRVESRYFHLHAVALNRVLNP